MISELQTLYRSHFGQLVASVTRITGDLALAEDAIHDAFLKASEKWSEPPLPDHMVGWLMTTARNGALDSLRRATALKQRLPEVAYMEAMARAGEQDLHEHETSDLADDMLRLIFTCCHPALNNDAQVALCLSTVCGLRTEQVAKAFIVGDATMSQRLWRAKTKIRDAGIAYSVPEGHELEPRLDAVLSVIYLIFNEGWLASGGNDGAQDSLTREAIRLARLLAQLMTANSEPTALLGLMLIQDSRRQARFDRTGQLVLLRDQDRQLWDREKIHEGEQLVRNVFKQGDGNSRYAILGAIACVHASATTAKDTDWREIAALYEHLMALDASAVVALNYAVAIGERDGPKAGLEQLDSLASSSSMRRYHLFHATQGDFLRRLNRPEQARQAYARALEYAQNKVEREFLTSQYNSIAP